MQFPTLQDITALVTGNNPEIAKKFDYVHKLQLYYLWQAGTLLQNTAKKFQQGGNNVSTEKVQAYTKYLNKVKDLYLSWLGIQSQIQIADASAPKVNLGGGDIFNEAGLNKIKNVLKSWNPNQELKTLGWVPLVVGASAALLGIWGIYEISKRFTTTVNDKIELLKATEETVLKLGLTPEQASKLIGDTQEQAHEGTGLMDNLKYGIFAFLAVTLIKEFTKNGK